MSTDKRLIKKHLLIIKSADFRVDGIRQFLENRDWRVVILSELKPALEYLLKEKPEFVMVSIDHPMPAVQKLAKVLPTVVSSCVIPFGEKPTTVSMKVLNDCNSKFAIFPPVTGPAIERTVFKYLKGESKEKAMTDAADTLRSEQGRSITGEGFDPEKAGTLGYRPESLINENEDPNLEQGFFLQDSSQNSSADPGQDSSSTAENSFDIDSLAAMLGGDAEGVLGRVAAQSPTKADPHSEDWRLPKVQYPSGKNPALINLNQKAKPSKSSNESADSANEGRAVTPPSRLKSRLQQSVQNIGKADMRVNEASLISIGSQKALDAASVASREPTEELGVASSVACIVIESTRFSGYLVAAMGNQRRIDENFVELVRERLVHFLIENGEEVSEQDQLRLKIKKVEFEDWAIECAEFLRKSVHHGNEVAMAFFPRIEARPKVGKSKDEKMAAVRLRDLKGDANVAFDLYLYLPTNDKYILYTKKGSVFFDKQKERLLTSGIEDMHVDKDEVQEFTKYVAQNYLNDQIARFEENKTKKKKNKKVS